MSNEAKSRKFVVREEVEPVDDDGIASSSSDHSSDSAPTTTTKVIGPTNPDRAQSSHSRGAGCDSSNETKGWNDGHEDSKVVDGKVFPIKYLIRNVLLDLGVTIHY
jgi:hypothetical protein